LFKNNIPLRQKQAGPVLTVQCTGQVEITIHFLGGMGWMKWAISSTAFKGKQRFNTVCFYYGAILLATAPNKNNDAS
jgi:hypothetical protein